MALGLRRSGGSVGAMLAFWLGNPMLNPATLVFMGFVLGWRWAVLRLAMALTLVFVVAYLVQWLVHGDVAVTEAAVIAGGGDAPADTGSIWTRWSRALAELTAGLIPEYLLIVLALGAARAWLFPAVTPSATGPLWTVGLAIAGTLFVIPTAGEIPITQALMRLGLGVAPAAALMTTLPPVSLPSLAMLRRVLPSRAVLAVAASVAALGVLSGVLATALGF